MGNNLKLYSTFKNHSKIKIILINTEFNHPLNLYNNIIYCMINEKIKTYLWKFIYLAVIKCGLPSVDLLQYWAYYQAIAGKIYFHLIGSSPLLFTAVSVISL